MALADAMAENVGGKRTLMSRSDVKVEDDVEHRDKRRVDGSME